MSLRLPLVLLAALVAKAAADRPKHDSKQEVALHHRLHDMTDASPSEERAKLFDDLATLYAEDHKLDEAERYASLALDDRTALRGATDPDTAISVARVGAIKMRRGYDDEARQLLEGARHILEQTRDVDDPDVARVLTRLGELEWRTKHLDAARADLKRALTILRKHFDDKYPDIRDALRILASVDANAKAPR